MRLIAGVCTHYVVYNISKKKNTVDKSKIKDKRKVKPKDKSWVKIGWRTKNRKGWSLALVCSKTLAWYRSPQWQCRLECIQCGASDHTFSEGIPGNNCLGEEGTFKIVSPALVCCECVHICLP